MKNKVLFLDYDGVLFDTLREVYIVNRAIYQGIDFLNEIDEKNYNLYSKYKFLVYNIWMFYYFNPLIFDNFKEEKIIPAFEESLNNRDFEEEKKYCEKFLSLRGDLIKNQYDFWKNLEVPFEFFKEIKKMFNSCKAAGQLNIVIASKKNKSSILERLRANDFDLDEKYIFAREVLDNYSSKGEFFEQYMEENNFNKAIFVDDNPNNIKSCHDNKKIETILASWGNCGLDNKGMNQKEAVLKIKEFFDLNL